MKRARDEWQDLVSDREYVVALVSFVTEPNVWQCISSIQNDCLINDIVFTENRQTVNGKFHRHIQFPYKVGN